MKVEIRDKGMIIKPETEFESSYLRQFEPDRTTQCFLKHGSSISDVVGFVVNNLSVTTANADNPQEGTR